MRASRSRCRAGSARRTTRSSFTEPFLFDRNITGGAQPVPQRRPLHRPVHAAVDRRHGHLRLAGWQRLHADVHQLQLRARARHRDQHRLHRPARPARNPFLRDSLLHRPGRRAGHQQGRCRASSTTRSTSRSSRRPAVAFRSALGPRGPRRQHQIHQAVDRRRCMFFKQNNRMSFGFRGQGEYVRGDRATRDLPIFEKLFHGRRVHHPRLQPAHHRPVRTCRPGWCSVVTRACCSTSSRSSTIAGPVRLILFYDAGQVRDTGESFAWKEDIRALVQAPIPLLVDPLASVGINPCTAQPDGTCVVDPVKTQVTGQRSAFKTSTGAEVRFFMPVLNVPFRLIFAYNPQRGGVLDNTLRPAEGVPVPVRGRDDLLIHSLGSTQTKGFSCNERFRHSRGGRVRREHIAGVCSGARPRLQRRARPLRVPRSPRLLLAPRLLPLPSPLPLLRRRLRSRGRQGCLRQPAGHRPAVGRRQGGSDQGERSGAEEADRGRGQDEDSSGQPAEAARPAAA